MPDENLGGSPNAPDATATPKPVTEDMLGNFVNSAITNQLKRFSEKTLPSLFEAQLKPLTEALKAAQSAPPPPEEKDKKAGPDPRIAALEQQLLEFKAQAQAAEEKRLAAERKSRDDKAYSDLRAEVARHVRPDVVDVVAGYMFKVQGVVDVPEDGEPVFKSRRMNLGIEEEVALPIKDGVAGWAKSDAAKPYLPAPNSSSAPQTRKQGHQSPQLPDNMDLSKATPEQRLQAASQMEVDIQRKLDAAGIKF